MVLSFGLKFSCVELPVFDDFFLFLLHKMKINETKETTTNNAPATDATMTQTLCFDREVEDKILESTSPRFPLELLIFIISSPLRKLSGDAPFARLVPILTLIIPFPLTLVTASKKYGAPQMFDVR
ncbi:hypothetical protein R6Q59_035417 [Mikania micrantha]